MRDSEVVNNDIRKLGSCYFINLDENAPPIQINPDNELIEYSLEFFLKLSRKTQPRIPIASIVVRNDEDMMYYVSQNQPPEQGSIYYQREKGIHTYADLPKLMNDLKQEGKLGSQKRIVIYAKRVNRPFQAINIFPKFVAYQPSVDQENKEKLKSLVGQVKSFIEKLPELTAEGDLRDISELRKIEFEQPLTQKEAWDLLTLACEGQLELIQRAKFHESKQYIRFVTKQGVQCCLFLGSPHMTEPRVKNAGLYCAPANGLGLDYDDGILSVNGRPSKIRGIRLDGVSEAMRTRFLEWKDSGFQGPLFTSDYPGDQKRLEDLRAEKREAVRAKTLTETLFGILLNRAATEHSDSTAAVLPGTLPGEMVNAVAEQIVSEKEYRQWIKNFKNDQSFDEWVREKEAEKERLNPVDQNSVSSSSTTTTSSDSQSTAMDLDASTAVNEPSLSIERKVESSDKKQRIN